MEQYISRNITRLMQIAASNVALNEQTLQTLGVSESQRYDVEMIVTLTGISHDRVFEVYMNSQCDVDVTMQNLR